MLSNRYFLLYIYIFAPRPYIQGIITIDKNDTNYSIIKSFQDFDNKNKDIRTNNECINRALELNNNMKKSGKAIVAIVTAKNTLTTTSKNLYCRLIKSDNGQPLPTKNIKLLRTKDKLIKDMPYIYVFSGDKTKENKNIQIDTSMIEKKIK